MCMPSYSSVSFYRMLSKSQNSAQPGLGIVITLFQKYARSICCIIKALVCFIFPSVLTSFFLSFLAVMSTTTSKLWTQRNLTCSARFGRSLVRCCSPKQAPFPQPNNEPQISPHDRSRDLLPRSSSADFCLKPSV